MKKAIRCFLKGIGYLLIGIGSLWAFSGSFTSLIMLFSADVDLDFGGRIISFLFCLVITAISLGVVWGGYQLKKKSSAAASSTSVSLPTAEQESGIPGNAPQPGPQLKHTETRGAWMQLDYQWPHRFGYDYMLNNVQWLITHDLSVQTLTTAEIAGAPEQEHIQDFNNCGGSLAECVGREAGVLAVGGFSKSANCLMKIYWYNQTHVVRIFTAGEAEQGRINAFADMLFTAKNAQNDQ